MLLTNLNLLIKALHGRGVSYEAIQAAMVEAVGVSRRVDLTPETLPEMEDYLNGWLESLDEVFDEEKEWEAHMDYLTFLRGDWQYQ